jgi:hypothetical protein
MYVHLTEVVDATLLALAGLKRLGMEEVIKNGQIIDWDVMLPAVAQVRTRDLYSVSVICNFNECCSNVYTPS